MFGVGGQEMVLIGLLLLLAFGPSKLTETARDLGRFAYRVHVSMEEFKSELASAEYQEPQEAAKGQRSTSEEV
jgi:Sec-independent protein translocase protein TatA